ncbi:hypothetical protein FXO37_29870 [Capsicum annuum]|nr:hypothetical protein FXO37_29870 [Capsicum annuum]
MEGEEPLYLWDAFSNFLPLTEKLKNGGDTVESSSKVCPGERKVDAYKIDFEIFQIATSGDFVPPFASCETEYETHLPVRESSWSMLRGKFVSGNMKDFVFSTKSGNPSDKEAAVFGGFHELWEKKRCNEKSSAVLDGVVDTGGASCNLVKPVVYRWPSLEKFATCSIDALDSKGAYIFIIPTSGFGKDAGEIDWKQAASEFLHQMVLPIDTNIKVPVLVGGSRYPLGFVKEAAVTSCQRSARLIPQYTYQLPLAAGGIPYKSDIPRAIWNPPFTRRGSLQPEYAARVGVPESDTPHDT